VGIDSAITEKVRAGVALAYLHTNVDGNANVSTQYASINTYEATAYGSYVLDNITELNWQASLGLHRNDNRRYFTGGSASGDFDTWTGQLGLGIAQAKVINDTTVIRPSLRAEYLYARDESFSETGTAGNIFNVSGGRTNELRLIADAKGTKELNAHTKLIGNLGVGYYLLHDSSSVSASIIGGGGTFVSSGIEPNRWFGQAGVGFVATTESAIEITGRYDIEWRESFDTQMASLKVRVPF